VKSWKIASAGPRTLDGVDIVRSVSSLLRAHLLIATQVPISTAESGFSRAEPIYIDVTVLMVGYPTESAQGPGGIRNSFT
jgi:hypothetical protein